MREKGKPFNIVSFTTGKMKMNKNDLFFLKSFRKRVEDVAKVSKRRSDEDYGISRTSN